MHLGVDNTRGEISAGDGSPIVSHCVVIGGIRLSPPAGPKSTTSATLHLLATASAGK